MTTPDRAAIKQFIDQMLELWNAGDREGFMELYRRSAPGGLRLEFPVGAPAVGWEGLEAMCDEHLGKTKVNNLKLIINGSEAAAVMSNVHEDGSIDESIESYRFDPDGSLFVRWFHPRA
jgi:hypothetical protein